MHRTGWIMFVHFMWSNSHCFAKHDSRFPVIEFDDRCFSQTDISYTDKNANVFCSVHGATPNVSLSLWARTTFGDRRLASEVSTHYEGNGYTTFVSSRDIFLYSSHLVLLVCKAGNHPLISKHYESVVLLHRYWNLSTKHVIHLNAKRDSKVILDCTNNTTEFFAWKKVTSSRSSQDNFLLYAIYLDKPITHTFRKEFNIDGQNSLVIPRLDDYHEGRYICLFGDGMNNGITVYDILVLGTYVDDKKKKIRSPRPQPIISSVLFGFLEVALGVIFISTYHWKRVVSCMKKKDKGTQTVNAVVKSGGTINGNLKGVKGEFLREIKVKYKDWYSGILPVPSFKDGSYCVNNVFVNGGIEFLNSNVTGEKEIWTNLKSYKDLFCDPRVKSKRYLVESLPGFGKTTFSLQIAYDWCNSNSCSCMRHVDILLLLRLRQLGGVASLTTAIKQFILPIDSRISENDVANLLRESKSVLLILDGFDEYPDKDSPTSDFISIIDGRMFQQFQVVTTARSSSLPKTYSSLTKRVRLSGFDFETRRCYIRKAIAGVNSHNESKVQKTIKYFQENLILNDDLCRVPLLITQFAHLVNEHEDFQRVNSFTSVFRHVILCFHSHMGNKMEDDNVAKFELFETNHDALNKLAYEELCEKSQKSCWEEDNLRQMLGHMFYDQYVRTGILVEEKMLEVVENQSILVKGRYRKRVKFFHKLFAQWYAAHFVSSFLQKNPYVSLRQIFKFQSPFDIPHFFRFLCGINLELTDKIISYIKSISGCDKFAILCLLEKTGIIYDIRNDIVDIRYETFVVSGYDSLFEQLSCLQILKIASEMKVQLQMVILFDCIESVKMFPVEIKTTSGLCLPPQIATPWLDISTYNREMLEYEAFAFLLYTTECPSIQWIRFRGRTPPTYIERGNVLSELKSRKVSVMYSGGPDSYLNLSTGSWQWQSNGRSTKRDEIQKKHSQFITELRKGTNEMYTLWARNYIQYTRELNKRIERERAEARANSHGRDASNDDNKSVLTGKSENDEK